MVARILQLPGLPQTDAADALAIAITHANTHAGLVRMAKSQNSTRGHNALSFNNLPANRLKRGRVR